MHRQKSAGTWGEDRKVRIKKKKIYETEEISGDPAAADGPLDSEEDDLISFKEVSSSSERERPLHPQIVA